MFEVIHFNRRVDAQQQGDFFLAAVFAFDDEGGVLLRFDFAVQAFEAEGFFAGEAEGLNAVAAFELQGEDAHADQVGAVDAFEALGDDGFYAQQLRAFGGPVAA